MGIRIKTNVESLVAQRQLSNNRQEMMSSLEKLSTGQRINKSADDAAGLAMSEAMRAKIRGLGQAKRNAGDGVSYLQVAEGGLSEVNNIMVRMRELTTQAASDTIGGVERGFLNKEFQELGKEVARIISDTEFNGAKVLSDQQQRDLKIQIGVSYRGEGSTADPEQDYITIQQGDLTELNDSIRAIGDVSIEGENGQELGGGDTNDIFSKIDNAMTTMTKFRANLGALQSRLNSAMTSIDVSSENLNAAQSRIRDVDYASETAKMTQGKILTAAGTSVLTQANSMPETVLQLLRG